jgi:hypothetical protein
MPSLSGKTKIRRKAKLKASGKRRKRLLRHGTTPKFPIHLDGKEQEQEKETKTKEV